MRRFPPLPPSPLSRVWNEAIFKSAESGDQSWKGIKMKNQIRTIGDRNRIDR